MFYATFTNLHDKYSLFHWISMFWHGYSTHTDVWTRLEWIFENWLVASKNILIVCDWIKEKVLLIRIILTFIFHSDAVFNQSKIFKEMHTKNIQYFVQALFPTFKLQMNSTNAFALVAKS